MKLPKSIIKKYGITKKAWQVFRGKKTKARSKTMAKKKGSGSRKGKNWLGELIVEIAPFGYGLVRADIGNGIQAAAQKMNIHSPYADEATMTGITILSDLLVKNPTVKKVSSKIRGIELERVGELTRLRVPLSGSQTASSAGIVLN